MTRPAAQGRLGPPHHPVTARGPARLTDANLQGPAGRLGVGELVVELRGGPDVGGREVVLARQRLDVPVGDVALLRVEPTQRVIDGLPLTEELVLQGDEVLGHGP
jgi:hypothetical protein